jgi:hypothetical protein
MNLTGPRQLSWWMGIVIWVGVIAGILGILANFGLISELAGASFWLLAGGFLLIALAAGVIYIAIINKP